jgi:hypothetical protein
MYFRRSMCVSSRYINCLASVPNNDNSTSCLTLCTAISIFQPPMEVEILKSRPAPDHKRPAQYPVPAFEVHTILYSNGLSPLNCDVGDTNQKEVFAPPRTPLSFVSYIRHGPKGIIHLPTSIQINETGRRLLKKAKMIRT